MADLLAQSSAWLEKQRHKLRTVPVTYVRGTASVALQATIGRTVFEQRDDYGVIEKTESRDFLVRAEDLVLEGALTLPERGDEVRETDEGGKVFVCDVIYCACKPEADSKGISDEEFGRAMAGDAVDHATTALLEELVDFFPQARRRLLAKALAKLKTLEARALDVAEMKLDGPELEAEMEAALQSICGSSGSLPGSPGSTPGR